MHTATLTATDEFGNEDLVVRWRNYTPECREKVVTDAAYFAGVSCERLEGFQFVLDLPDNSHILLVWEGGDEWSSATRTPSEQEQVEVQPSDLGTRSHMIR